METCALPNQEAATVAEVLVKKFVARCGVPQLDGTVEFPTNFL